MTDLCGDKPPFPKGQKIDWGGDNQTQTIHILYKLLFSRGFYFREFREPDPREISTWIHVYL